MNEVVNRHSLAHSDKHSDSQLRALFLTVRTLVQEALNDIPADAGIDLDADEIYLDSVRVAVPVLQTVNATDLKEESIETIFSLLEEDRHATPSLLSVEGYLPDQATVTLKRRDLQKLAKVEDVARSILTCGLRLDQAEPGGPGDKSDKTSKISNPYDKQKDFGGTALEKGFYAYSFGTYKFSVIRCARVLGPTAEPRHVYAALRRLQDSGELEMALDTTPRGRAVHLRFKCEGIRMFRARGAGDSNKHESLTENVETTLASLSDQFSAKERSSVGKVQSMYEIMHHVSTVPKEDDSKIFDSESDTEPPRKSNRLQIFQSLVKDYFGGSSDGTIDSSYVGKSSTDSLGNDEIQLGKVPIAVSNFPIHNHRMIHCISSDVASLMADSMLRMHDQLPHAVRLNSPNSTDYRDLCIARILHSIDAPRAPILQWYNHPLWGKYRSNTFSSVIQAVKSTFD